jgi:hypothetical protein
MGKRGRKSAAELAMAPLIEIEPRPVAPDELTDEESAQWESIVARMPSKWFTKETWPLLVQLCRHIIAARRLAQLIHQAEEGDEAFLVDQWMRLLRALTGQTAIITSVSTKLRITPQSSYDAKVAGTAKGNSDGDFRKPWDY